MIGHLIRARERYHAQRDTNRRVRPFEWGASFITEHVNGDDPRQLFRQHTQDVMKRNHEFYALPPILDYQFDGE